MRTQIEMQAINPKTDALAVPGIDISFEIASKITGEDGRIYITMVDGVEIDGPPNHKFWVERNG